MKAANLFPHNVSKASILKIMLMLSLILVSISALGAIRTPSASAASSLSTYPMQGSIVWSFYQGTSPSNSYFEFTVGASGANAAFIPSHISVSFSISYNGTVYYNHGCSLNYLPLQTSASCSFTAPFHGDGEYAFSATFTNNAGNIVAQNTTDPRIDPDWH